MLELESLRPEFMKLGNKILEENQNPMEPSGEKDDVQTMLSTLLL